MADTGTQKYWFHGLPAEGLEATGRDAGTQKYWLCGLPAEFLYPAAPAALGRSFGYIFG